MAINLANLNISLDQFQKMATGDYNAGEVALKSESKLTKINNHVHRLSANTKSISHEEVLAIKNAFMKALSANGVDMDEINKIRKELGLAPDETAPKALAWRSIKPLSRQQIRDIIDRNANAINAARAERGQKAFKTSAQLYGTNQTTLHNLEQYRRAASDSVRRTMMESEEIANFQKIIGGNAAEVAGDDRFETLKMVLAQRDAIIAKAKGNPKTEGNCVLEYTTETGQKIQFASSRSERDTIRMLDEAYLILDGGTDVRKRNDAIALCLTGTFGKPIPFEINEMINSVRAEATAVFGEGAVVQADKPLHRLTNSHTVCQDVAKLTAEGKAVTADNFREAYRANCFTQSAANLVERTVEGLLREMGRKTSDCASIRSDLQKIMPKTFSALAEAKTADEAKTILDGAMGTIRETTAKAAAAIDAYEKLEDFMNEAFAKEIGVKWNPANGKLASFGYLANRQGDALKTDILTGKVKAGTPEEITAEFKKLAQETAHAHAEFLRDADALGLFAQNTAMQGKVLAAGYHKSELPMLADAFAFIKSATGCSDADALRKTLDPASPERRLFQYGGRFTASADNFKAGLKLMDTFKTWFENTAANVKSKNCNTLTEKNAGSTFLAKEGLMGFEKFVFEDIALDPTFNLAAPDAEKAFGIENNKAMNFFARGNGSGCTGTVAQLSPEKRQVVYAVFAALEPPSPQPKGATNVAANSDTLSRILRHFDEIVELKNSGKLDRTHINAVLVPDLEIPPDASPRAVNDVFMNKLYKKYGTNQGKLMEVSNYIEQSGCTLEEALAAAEGKGPKPKTLADYSPTTMKIEEIDGTTKGGRSLMLGDFVRPQNPKYLDGTRILGAEQNHFTVKIGQETFTADGKNDGAGNTVIADRIETLCGEVHVSQASSVMRALSQAAHQALLPLLPEHGIQGGVGNEHIPLTYTLSRNDETGAITIRYSEPEGMPVKFHWETTVALDGSSTSTPIQFTETLEESGNKALAKTAGGTSPAAKTMQNFILDASGAQENAPVMEKLSRFNAKLQEETRKDLVTTFAHLVNKHLVKKDGGGNRTEDFDGVHYQFNRDVVAGGMTVNLPGGGTVSTTNYETARDQLVQFITGDANATYKTAQDNVKKQTGLLMSIVTQYAPTMVKNAFVSTLSNGGHEMSLAGGRMKIQNPFEKPMTWTLGKAEDGSIKASVTITSVVGFFFSAQGQTQVDDTASYEETTLDITIPAGNLSSLADQDWSMFDEGAFNAAGKDTDAQLKAIPQQFRLEATVNASYNLHFDAPAPAS